MATVKVAGPNKATYIMESFLWVFMSYFGIHQGFGLRGCRRSPPIANGDCADNANNYVNDFVISS